MAGKFGVVNISLAFSIDLDDLAEALEMGDETLEQMIIAAKENFVDTVGNMRDGEIFDWLDTEMEEED